MGKKSYCLLVIVTVIGVPFIVMAEEGNSMDGIPIKPSEYCKQNGPTLSCSFKSTRQTVYMNTTLEASLQKIFISSAPKFVIDASVCANVSLTDVSDAKVVGNVKDTNLRTNCPHMGIWLNNSTLDRLPPATTRLYVEKSNLGQLILEELDGRMTLISSSFDHVELKKPVINHTIQFYNSKIQHLKKLELASGAKLYLQNTEVESLEPKALVIGRDSSVIFAGDQDLKFLDGELHLQPGSYVKVNKFSSDLNFKVQNEALCECDSEFQCKSYLYTIVVLTGIIISLLLVIIYLVLFFRKLKIVHQRELHEKSDIIGKVHEEADCEAETDPLYGPRKYPEMKQTENEEKDLFSRVAGTLMRHLADDKGLGEHQTCNNKQLNISVTAELTALSDTPPVQKSAEQKITMKASNEVPDQRTLETVRESILTESHACADEIAKSPPDGSPVSIVIYTQSKGTKATVQDVFEIKGTQKKVKTKDSLLGKAKEGLVNMFITRVESGMADMSNRKHEPFSKSAAFSVDENTPDGHNLLDYKCDASASGDSESNRSQRGTICDSQINTLTLPQNQGNENLSKKENNSTDAQGISYTHPPQTRCMKSPGTEKSLNNEGFVSTIIDAMYKATASSKDHYNTSRKHTEENGNIYDCIQ